MLLAAWEGGPRLGGSTLAFLVLPLGATMYPEALAAYCGPLGAWGSVRRPSPPGLVALFGWILLLLPLAFLLAF